MFFSFLALIFSLQSQAAVATDASIEKLLEITKVESMSETIGSQMEKMKSQLESNLREKRPAGDPKMKAFSKELDRLTQEFKKENLTFASMKSEIIKIYKDSWTEEEINDLIKFYETPTGKKSIETAPLMMQKTMTIVQNKLQANFPAFQEKLKALVEKYMPEETSKGPKKR